MGEAEPFKDEDWLREQYWVLERSLSEIASDYDVDPNTVRYWMEKYGIARREPGIETMEHHIRPSELWHSERWLRMKYHEEGMSTAELKEEAGAVDREQIRMWMKRHGIERREVGASRKRHPGIHTVPSTGYVQAYGGRNSEGVYESVLMHRLLAVAIYGFDAVKPDMDVHHKNGIPWDNRPSNIELLTKSEHTALHAKEDQRSDA